MNNPVNFAQKRSDPRAIEDAINPMATTIPNQQAPNNGEPITFSSVPAPILALGGKSTEEKMYIIYWENNENTIGFNVCKGRMECYVTIGRILSQFEDDDSNAPDILMSKVAVEIPVVNKDGNGIWAMTHPDKAATVYQFCKAMEGYFSEEIRFDIDQYLTESVEDDAVEYEGPRSVDVGEIMRGKKIFDGDQGMREVYQEAMNDQNRGAIPTEGAEGEEV